MFLFYGGSSMDERQTPLTRVNGSLVGRRPFLLHPLGSTRVSRTPAGVTKEEARCQPIPGRPRPLLLPCMPTIGRENVCTPCWSMSQMWSPCLIGRCTCCRSTPLSNGSSDTPLRGTPNSERISLCFIPTTARSEEHTSELQSQFH